MSYSDTTNNKIIKVYRQRPLASEEERVDFGAAVDLWVTGDTNFNFNAYKRENIEIIPESDEDENIDDLFKKRCKNNNLHIIIYFDSVHQFCNSAGNTYRSFGKPYYKEFIQSQGNENLQVIEQPDPLLLPFSTILKDVSLSRSIQMDG